MTCDYYEVVGERFMNFSLDTGQHFTVTMTYIG